MSGIEWAHVAWRVVDLVTVIGLPVMFVSERADRRHVKATRQIEADLAAWRTLAHELAGDLARVVGRVS